MGRYLSRADMCRYWSQADIECDWKIFSVYTVSNKYLRWTCSKQSVFTKIFRAIKCWDIYQEVKQATLTYDCEQDLVLITVTILAEPLNYWSLGN